MHDIECMRVRDIERMRVRNANDIVLQFDI